MNNQKTSIKIQSIYKTNRPFVPSLNFSMQDVEMEKAQQTTASKRKRWQVDFDDEEDESYSEGEEERKTKKSATSTRPPTSQFEAIVNEACSIFLNAAGEDEAETEEKGAPHVTEKVPAAPIKPILKHVSPTAKKQHSNKSVSIVDPPPVQSSGKCIPKESGTQRAEQVSIRTVTVPARDVDGRAPQIFKPTLVAEEEEKVAAPAAEPPGMSAAKQRSIFCQFLRANYPNLVISDIYRGLEDLAASTQDPETFQDLRNSIPEIDEILNAGPVSNPDLQQRVQIMCLEEELLVEMNEIPRTPNATRQERYLSLILWKLMQLPRGYGNFPSFLELGWLFSFFIFSLFSRSPLTS